MILAFGAAYATGKSAEGIGIAWVKRRRLGMRALVPIVMAGELLTDRSGDREEAQLLGVISSSAKRGAELVRQILLFARGMEGPRVAVSPASLFTEIRTFLDSTLPKSPYVGVQYAAIPEFQAIGVAVGQQMSAALAGKVTVDAALKTSQAAAEREMTKGGYYKK